LTCGVGGVASILRGTSFALGGCLRSCFMVGA
jgi:hypothetical protein